MLLNLKLLLIHPHSAVLNNNLTLLNETCVDLEREINTYKSRRDAALGAYDRSVEEYLYPLILVSAFICYMGLTLFRSAGLSKISNCIQNLGLFCASRQQNHRPTAFVQHNPSDFELVRQTISNTPFP